MRLMEQIQKQFAQEIPLPLLGSDDRTSSELLHSEVDSLPWSPLVPIQPAGDKPPFCVHPVLGVAFHMNWHII